MAHDRKFRFGVQTTLAHGGGAVQRSGDVDADGWRNHARKVEDLGYSTLFMPDHFDDTVLAPVPALAMAAEATTTLKVGSLVYGNDYKHPAILAKEMVTIDELAGGGRVEFGIGAGWMLVDYTQLGIPYDKPSVRIQRLDEAVHIIKESLRGEMFSFDGEHYTMENYTGKPVPRQGSLPLTIGGGGQKLLTLAGREADIVGINPNLRKGAITADAATDSVKEQTLRKIGWVRDGAGERFDELELQIRYFLAAINPDREAFAQAIAPAFGLDAQDALESGTALVGTVEEVCDQLVRRREEWGVSYVIVGEDTYEDFAPVVAKLAGT